MNTVAQAKKQMEIVKAHTTRPVEAAIIMPSVISFSLFAALWMVAPEKSALALYATVAGIGTWILSFFIAWKIRRLDALRNHYFMFPALFFLSTVLNYVTDKQTWGIGWSMYVSAGIVIAVAIVYAIVSSRKASGDQAKY